MAWFANHYATTIVRIVAPVICHRTTAMILTEIVEKEKEEFVIYRSPEAAAHSPDYVDICRFATRVEADAFLSQS